MILFFFYLSLVTSSVVDRKLEKQATKLELKQVECVFVCERPDSWHRIIVGQGYVQNTHTRSNNTIVEMRRAREREITKQTNHNK